MHPSAFPARPAPRLRPLLSACLLSVCLCAAPAIEVTYRSNDTVQAEKVTFDGVKFQIFRSGVQTSLLPEALKYIEADEEPLTRRIRDLEKTRDQLTAERDAERQAREAAEKSRGGDRDLAGQLVQAETAVRRLDRDLEARTSETLRLGSEAEGLRAALAEKDKQIAALQAASGPAAPAPPSFLFPSNDFLPAALPGRTRVRGVAENRTSAAYRTVVLEVSGWDAAGKPLATAHTYVPNFQGRDSRPFTAELAAPPESVRQIQVRVVHAVPQEAGGGAPAE